LLSLLIDNPKFNLPNKNSENLVMNFEEKEIANLKLGYFGCPHA
jgi:hypothetical protein